MYNGGKWNYTRSDARSDSFHITRTSWVTINRQPLFPRKCYKVKIKPNSEDFPITIGFKTSIAADMPVWTTAIKQALDKQKLLWVFHSTKWQGKGGS